MPIQNATEPELSKTGESQPHKNPWLRVFIYLVLIAAGAFIGWRVYQNKEKTAANTAHQAAALMNRPVPVQVVPAEQKAMPIYLTGLGTVTPNFTVTVKARVSGELLPVKFTEGQEVKEGETITAPLETAGVFPPMVISMVDGSSARCPQQPRAWHIDAAQGPSTASDSELMRNVRCAGARR